MEVEEHFPVFSIMQTKEQRMGLGVRIPNYTSLNLLTSTFLTCTKSLKKNSLRNFTNRVDTWQYNDKTSGARSKMFYHAFSNSYNNFWKIYIITTYKMKLAFSP